MDDWYLTFRATAQLYGISLRELEIPKTGELSRTADDKNDCKPFQTRGPSRYLNVRVMAKKLGAVADMGYHDRDVEHLVNLLRRTSKRPCRTRRQNFPI